MVYLSALTGTLRVTVRRTYLVVEPDSDAFGAVLINKSLSERAIVVQIVGKLESISILCCDSEVTNRFLASNDPFPRFVPQNSNTKP